MYVVSTNCICCPAILFALSVADVKLLCCDPRTEDTEGSQMSVTKRAKAAACLPLSWCFGEDSQDGGEPKCFRVLDVLCGRGVNRSRSSD
jgi:hypothetical protein